MFNLAPMYTYALVALVAIGACLGIYAKGHSDGVDAEAARLTPQLDYCRAQSAVLSGKLATQNAAVASMKVESDRRQAEAAQRLAEASSAAQSARSEAERLRRAQGQPARPEARPAASGAPMECPAGAAVSVIREGLR